VTHPPLWRQAFDAVERRVTPRAEELVRTEAFTVGAALTRRAVTLARGSARDLTARAWHLVNLPAGTDVSRLRAQVGALDREVRRLTLQLEAAQRGTAQRGTERRHRPEETDADSAQSPDGPRPRPARRRAQRPARP
jgi:outer membrane murein-binding lipoprotein Lpp